MDLQGKVIAAVLDTNSRKKCCGLVGHKHSRYYFSGMMVFDLLRGTGGRPQAHYRLLPAAQRKIDIFRTGRIECCC